MDLLKGRRWLVGPATGMIVCSLLGLVYCFAFEVWVFVFNGDNMRNEMLTHVAYYTLIVIAVPGLAVIVYAVMLFGSVQMFRGKGYAWAKIASILALIPCSVLAFLTIGFGIWGVLVLRNEDVKAVFR